LDADLPLLEFDPDPEAVFSAADAIAGQSRLHSLPERAVLCFYAEIIESLPSEAERIGFLEAAHGKHPIWKVRRHDVDIAVFHPGVGAPLAAAFLEEAIAMGVNKAVACGGCGTLSADVKGGDIVVPTSAVRDEGTSFHYLPPSREVDADPDGVRIAVEVLTERDVPHHTGKVWTTDGFYRETAKRVATRKAEGCLVVDMEASAFSAVSQFRGIRFAQLLYGGDDLSGDEWDERAWTVSPSRRLTFDLALEIASRL
jgi:uridine phosphorylase